MALKRRIPKKEQSSQIRTKGNNVVEMECSECEILVENVSADAKSVICGRCVQKTVAPPDVRPKKADVEENLPRGWWRKKEYISPSGKRYAFGKEVSSDSE